MTQRQHAHAAATHEHATAEDDIAPGRTSLTARLVAPRHPLVSALIRREARDDAEAMVARTR
jgi:hypothetical protein